MKRIVVFLIVLLSLMMPCKAPAALAQCLDCARADSWRFMSKTSHPGYTSYTHVRYNGVYKLVPNESTPAQTSSPTWRQSNPRFRK